MGYTHFFVKHVVCGAIGGIRGGSNRCQRVGVTLHQKLPWLHHPQVPCIQFHPKANGSMVLDIGKMMLENIAEADVVQGCKARKPLRAGIKCRIYPVSKR